MPERIQRKRTKGWKMPKNTISVTRPGEFGNPFIVGGWYKIGNGGDGSFMWLRCLDDKVAKRQGFTLIKDTSQAVEWYTIYLHRYPLRQRQIDKLKGKNLACWCKIGDLCHADVLLEAVNKIQPKGE